MKAVQALFVCAEWFQIGEEVKRGWPPVLVAVLLLLVNGPTQALEQDSAASTRTNSSLSGEPVVTLARMQTSVQPSQGGDTGVVTFPAPGEYREQIPLTLTVSTDPANALVSYRYYKRADGRNWLCDITVRAPENGATVTMESMVLVAPHSQAREPNGKLTATVSDAQPWLRSTACVQSDDAAIRAKATELGAGTSDVEAYARKVINFTSQNKGTGAEFTTLDASRALQCGGSCTSRANLAAALLRAHGVPARTLAHLPTWSGPLYEHWLVEYWNPHRGWVWLESTMGKYDPAPTSLVVLAESSPEDEDRAFDKMQCRFVMPGAAYLSVHELAGELTRATSIAPSAANGASNVAINQGRLMGSPEDVQALYEAAQHSYARWAQLGKDSQPSSMASAIQAAARSGQAKQLYTVLTGKSLASVKTTAIASSTKGGSDEETAYKQKLASSQAKNGYSHPQSIHAMWELVQYYLGAQKYAQAENTLRYLNDACKKNPKNTPISEDEIKTAYAKAVAGVRSGSNSAGSSSSSSGSSTVQSAVSGSSRTSAGGNDHSYGSQGQETGQLSPANWFMAGSNPSEYQKGTESQGTYIKATSPFSNGFGTIMSNISPGRYRGRRIRFSARVRTNDVQSAQLWLRVDGPDRGQSLSFDNMDDRPIIGTTGWNAYNCVLDVPAESKNIAFGILLVARGQAWIEKVNIEEVGSSVPTTGR